MYLLSSNSRQYDMPLENKIFKKSTTFHLDLSYQMNRVVYRMQIYLIQITVIQSKWISELIYANKYFNLPEVTSDIKRTLKRSINQTVDNLPVSNPPSGTVTWFITIWSATGLPQPALASRTGDALCTRCHGNAADANLLTRPVTWTNPHIKLTLPLFYPFLFSIG